MTHVALLLAQQDAPESRMALAFLYLVLVGVSVAGLWATFEKAGQPGIASIVPIWNGIALLQIAGKPWWWIFLFLIPFVNIVVAIITYSDVAKNFGKGGGFTLGLIFLPFIFFMILGFGDARYQAGRAKFSIM